ncbi:DUF4153 domain-containing protein [Paenibacillus rhizoplanae]|uniref:DUF4153 domain-containing protein n=1 Tax=Paenibacillus rhizoplanae TaxID=1917181 RepID=UPI0036231E29
MTYMLSYRKPAWSGFALIGAALEHLFPQSLRNWSTALRLLRRGKGGMANERKQVLMRVLIGLLISVPLLLIVISLLSTADGVFSQLLEALPGIFDNISLGDWIFRGLWVLLVGLGMFGFVWGSYRVNPISALLWSVSLMRWGRSWKRLKQGRRVSVLMIRSLSLPC